MRSIAKSAKRLTRISVLTGRNAHHLVLGISPARMCSVCTAGLRRIEQRSIATGGIYSITMCSVHTIGLRRTEQRSIVTGGIYSISMGSVCTEVSGVLNKEAWSLFFGFIKFGIIRKAVAHQRKVVNYVLLCVHKK